MFWWQYVISVLKGVTAVGWKHKNFKLCSLILYSFSLDILKMKLLVYFKTSRTAFLSVKIASKHRTNSLKVWFYKEGGYER